MAIFVEDEEPVASRILYVNEAFERMSGYTSEQLIGHSALLLAGARPDWKALRAARNANKIRPYVSIEAKQRPDGTRYIAEVRLQAVGQAAGYPRHIVLTQRELV